MSALESRVEEYDHLRTWQDGGFCLDLYDTGRVTRNYKSLLAYRFFDVGHGEDPVFEGEDFACSPLHSIDSDKTLSSLLSFLSLKPGDTDTEFFEEYSPGQLAWVESRADDLGMYVYELACRFRPIGHEIAHEDWNQARAAGRYNRALVLRYQEHEMTLDAGESDQVDVYTDDQAVYALSLNYNLGYAGLQVFVDGDETDNYFFENAESDLGKHFLDLGRLEIMERLAEYLSL